MELGAAWPVELADAALERRVLTQLEGETPAAFAERVTSRIDALFGRGATLGALALACNERIDGAADDARKTLIGLSLGTMAKRQTGKVYLTASPRSSGRIREYLASLARGAASEWQSAGLEVSVDFGREAPPARGDALIARVA